MSRRLLHTFRPLHHQNPLGLPNRAHAPPAPQIPRRGAAPPTKRPIPHVRKVLVVASGKGGVGKSTVAVNLAFALATQGGARRRVGILDLDVFGPSVPKLMGLDRADEPNLTADGALIPLQNHGLPTMSMGYLLPRSAPDASNEDTPVVWRGLMVQKAVQQLLFDVDWRGAEPAAPGLDVLVVDMPPGTGDVPLTLGQLVSVDGAVIVSTPQDVALSDVRKGISMFRKVDVPITGIILNQAYFLCPSCSTPHDLFGPPDRFRSVAEHLGVPMLGELPLAPGVSAGGDEGLPYALVSDEKVRSIDGEGGVRWKETMRSAADVVWAALQRG
ncbi:P-loop containing nucleoside triphosphate hydrolase protein [Auriscalpium vulgare]|uniref:P-loop containing nucleoside triphosphate hydrolase protein n=1 Tax=Auriscalpium vulgare TaxID=40419 RepID=A0ACB8RCS8_9AGAM|nr:P-loop containing nucleoside triphosphate hydrolase protein [Auriscalpium vulgare]